MRRVGIEDQVTFTGGVSRNLGMVKAIEERLETRLNYSEESHYMGALGAALFALDQVLGGRAPSRSEPEIAR
jgi:activator of 2-hydroxyglutaryl-CoA dehydratase